MCKAKYKELYERLRNEILAGKYADRHVLPSEAQLSRRYACSRNTVRNALDELRHEGLIRCRQGKGAFVTKAGSARKIGLLLSGIPYSEYFQPVATAFMQLARELAAAGSAAQATFAGRLVGMDVEPIRVAEPIPAKSVAEPKPGRYVIDFGQNMPGLCEITATAPRGAAVRVAFGEMLNEDGTLYRRNLRGAAQLYDVIWPGGRRTLRPDHTYFGFRYAEVTGLAEAPSVTALPAFTAARKTGSFSSSNPMLNRLMANIAWTQRGNMHSIGTDCPQRNEGFIRAFPILGLVYLSKKNAHLFQDTFKEVVLTGNDLVDFIEVAKTVRGFGRSLKTAIADWIASNTNPYYAQKYRKQIADAIRLSRFKGEDSIT